MLCPQSQASKGPAQGYRPLLQGSLSILLSLSRVAASLFLNFRIHSGTSMLPCLQVLVCSFQSGAVGLHLLQGLLQHLSEGKENQPKPKPDLDLQKKKKKKKSTCKRDLKRARLGIPHPFCESNIPVQRAEDFETPQVKIRGRKPTVKGKSEKQHRDRWACCFCQSCHARQSRAKTTAVVQTQTRQCSGAPTRRS